MTKRPLVLFLAAVAPLFTQPNPPGDSLLFMEGVNLSYNNHYDDAEKAFREYLRRHPDDVLAELRLLYNRFFQTNYGKMLDAHKYGQFLGELNAAISQYEQKDCHGVDFTTSGRSLDCEYIGAAFYSLRMVLRGEHEGWPKVGGEYKKFLDYAERSGSPQAVFLLSMSERQLSKRSWPEQLAIRVFAHTSINADHAIATLMRSLKGNESPFANEIRLALLAVERESSGTKNPCDPARHEKGPALQELITSYPPNILFGYLQSKYPENAEVKRFATACGVSLR